MGLPEIIAKAKAKRLFKVRGKLFESKQVGTYTWTFVIWKISKGEKVFYSFSTTDSEIVSIIRNAKRNERFKVRFDIESKLYAGKFYTNLLAREIHHWEINEDKKNKEARIKSKQASLFEEKEYKRSIGQSEDF